MISFSFLSYGYEGSSGSPFFLCPYGAIKRVEMLKSTK